MNTVVTVVVLLVACYGALLYLSFFNGWHALGKRFRGDEKVLSSPSTRSYSNIRVTVGQVTYRSSILAGEAGLLLRRRFPFSLWFPSLLLPWSAIRLLEIRKDIKGQWALLAVPGVRLIPIILPIASIEGFLPTSNAPDGAATKRSTHLRTAIAIGALSFVITVLLMWFLFLEPLLR